MTAPKTKPAPPATAESTEPKPKPQRMPRRFALAEYCRTTYCAYADDDITLEEISAPAFWLHARNLRTHDYIEVHQNLRWSLLLVTNVIPGGGAEVAVLNTVEIRASRNITGKELPDGYEIHIAPAGSIGKYAVVRTRDGLVMNAHERHDDWGAAKEWLLGHAIFAIPQKPEFSHGGR